MSANTIIYVLVIKETASWLEVSAVTLDEACKTARAVDEEVIRVVRAQYEEPYSAYEW